MAGSNSAFAFAEESFARQIELGYNAGSKLKDRVTHEMNVVGRSHQFDVLGTVESTGHNPGDEVTLTDPGTATPTARLRRKFSFNVLEQYDIGMSDVPKLSRYGRQHGNAVGRAFDADIIEALKTFSTDAYTRSGLTASTLRVTTAGSGVINGDDIRKARGLLVNEALGADIDDDVTLVVGGDQWEHIAGDEKVASMDYAAQGEGTGNVTRTAMFSPLYGCHIVTIPQESRIDGHGKLDDKRAYMFARSAIGLASGSIEDMSVMEWVAMRRGYLVGAECFAGACRVQNAGVVEIRVQ